MCLLSLKFKHDIHILRFPRSGVFFVTTLVRFGGLHAKRSLVMNAVPKGASNTSLSSRHVGESPSTRSTPRKELRAKTVSGNNGLFLSKSRNRNLVR
jgi:hypothetical protein